MSLAEQEADAMRRAWEFLLHLGSGEIRIVGHITEVRQEARDIVKHFPLGGRIGNATVDDFLTLRERKKSARPVPDSLNIP